MWPNFLKCDQKRLKHYQREPVHNFVVHNFVVHNFVD